MTIDTIEKPRVLILGNVSWAKDKLEELKDIAQIETYTSTSREEFIYDLQHKYDGVTSIFKSWESAKITGRFDKKIAEHMPSSVKTISNKGAGYEHIDVDFFTDKGIQISNVTDPVQIATADTHFWLLLGALRNFGQAEKNLRKGKWITGVDLGEDPSSKVLGILGMGGIGRRVRDRAQPFGFKKIIYNNRSRLDPAIEKDSEFVSLDELLQTADIISINVPLNEETRHLINEKTLAKAKDGVIIVNTARGPIIDEKALVNALASGKVKSVGLDVFHNEPEVSPELLENDKVILTPHFGILTKKTLYDTEAFVIANIRSYLTTGKLISPVPEQKGKF